MFLLFRSLCHVFFSHAKREKKDAVSTPELVKLHQVNLREQDESLDMLAGSLQRQRQIGEHIG